MAKEFEKGHPIRMGMEVLQKAAESIGVPYVATSALMYLAANQTVNMKEADAVSVFLEARNAMIKEHSTKH